METHNHHEKSGGATLVRIMLLWLPVLALMGYGIVMTVIKAMQLFTAPDLTVSCG